MSELQRHRGQREAFGRRDHGGHRHRAAPRARLLTLLMVSWVAIATCAPATTWAAPNAAVDRGFGVWIAHCGGCHTQAPPETSVWLQAGAQRERIEALWRRMAPNPPPLPMTWLPVVRARPRNPTTTPWDRTIGNPLPRWNVGDLARTDATLTHGHPLPAGARAWPQGPALDDLRTALEVYLEPARSARQHAMAVGWLVLALLIAGAIGARRTLRQRLRSALPGPGVDGLLVGLALLIVPYVRLRPAPIDALVPLLAAWAFATGAVPRLAWAGLAAYVVWLACSALGLIDAIPLVYEPTFWSYFAAELELPLLALALVGIAARAKLSHDRLLTTLWFALIVESLAIAALLAVGQEGVVINFEPQLLGLPRVAGFFRDPNIFGGFHAFLIGLLWMRWTDRRPVAAGELVWGPLAMALAGVWVLASGSRSSLAAVAACGGIAAVRVWRNPTLSGRNRRILAATAGLALAGSAWWLAKSDLDALLRRNDPARIALLRRGLSTIDATSWLVGNGLLDAERRAGWTAPHLTIVRILGEQGLLRWALLAATLRLAAPGLLAWRRIGLVAVGLVVPALLIDVAHWRALALVPLLALAAQTTPAAAVRWRPNGWRAAVVALVGGLLAMIVVWRIDPTPANASLQVRMAWVAPGPASGIAAEGLPADWSDPNQAPELLEDAIRARDPELAFERVDHSGKLIAHGRLFAFSLPLAGTPGYVAQLSRIACVALRGPDPSPCPRFGSDEGSATAAAWRAIETGLVRGHQVQTHAPDQRPRRRAAVLAGLAVAGLLFALGLAFSERRAIGA